jgi:L-gulono-1,4-lactone dehydrogenase
MADWNNWAETVVYKQLEREYEPKNKAELSKFVKEAADKGWQLRAVGQGHAWSNLGVPRRRGAVIDIRRLNKVLNVDKTAKIVEVEGGMSIEDLNDALFKNGLALKNMGDANPQTIAGAFSTETHGSGVNIGSLSEMVEGMTIVRANGEFLELEGDQLKAGRVSLGKLGVIYSVKLGVRDAFYLHHKQELVDLAAEEPLLNELLKKPHLEYWYYPYTGKAERITREELSHPAIDNPLDIFEEWFIKATSDFIEATGIHHPERLPAYLGANVKDDKPGFRQFSRKGPSHKILLGKSNVWRRVVKTFTMEYQFPLKNFWTAVEALDKSIALAGKKGVYVAAPIQFRFTRKSERSFLSHMLHQPTVSFSVSFFRKHQGAHTWLPELEQRFIALQGKPHWGKMYYEKPEKTPASEAFEAIRKQLDPDGVFAFEQAPYTPDAEAFQDPRGV